MKRVNIHGDIGPRNSDSPYRRQHAYEVFLGNGRRVEFSSKRDALAYVADVRRWLGELLLEANTLHAECYMDYRMAWPQLGEGLRTDMRDAEPRLRELMAEAVWHLDRAASPVPKSSIVFPWRDLQQAFGKVIEAYKILERFHRAKTQGVLRWRMAMRRQQCEHALQRMKEYGATPQA